MRLLWVLPLSAPVPFEEVVASPRRSGSLQSARVHRVDRNVRSNRRGRCRPKLRLVVDSVLRDAAREVDHRLLLREGRQHFDRVLNGGELAVGVENIELGVVLRKAAGVVSLGAGRGSPAFGQVGSLSDHQGLQVGDQLLADRR